jgi:hypothetical protein
MLITSVLTGRLVQGSSNSKINLEAYDTQVNESIQHNKFYSVPKKEQADSEILCGVS